MLKFFIFQLVALFLGLFGTVQAAPGNITNVEDLYTKHCSICHGDNGDGNSRARAGMDPKPRDFTSTEAAMELTRERMIASVTYGRPGTAMMAHEGRLSSEQIESLVDFIRDKFMRTPTEHVPGPGGAEVPEKVLASPLMVTGEKIYTANCSVCHGDKGNTAFWAQNGLNPPPKNFTAPESLQNLSRERMIRAVTYGRPGTGMMSFSKRLSENDIKAVVTYIRVKFMGVELGNDDGEPPMAQKAGHSKPAVPQAHAAAGSVAGAIPGVDAPLSSAPQEATPHGGDHAGMPVMGMNGTGGGHEIDADMSLPTPNGLKGDALWGRDFYMKNCFTCHGIKGDGQGPRAYFNIPRPRNFTSEASRRILNRPRVFESITKGRVGTVMPAWGKVLTTQQIANLTEYVFTAYIHPESEASSDKKKAN